MMTSSRQTRQITRGDVARHAGVSTAVVSYVVNNGPRGVAPETAERVRESVRVLGYQPNFNARALKRGSNQTIGAILRDSLNPFYIELYQAIEKVAADWGLRMLVADSHGDPHVEQQLLSELSSRQLDGIFLIGTAQGLGEITTLRKETIPVLLLDCPGPFPGLTSIGPDAQAGAMTAVQHLIEVHDRTSVGLLIGDGFGDPDPRQLGWANALSNAGLEPGPIEVNDWSNSGGYSAAREMLSRGTLPQSMFIASDNQAVGFIRALHEAGIDIPRDCPIVSFDGTQSSAYAWPALTSVRQPVNAMAKRALELLENPDASSSFHAFDVELVIRESCGCILPDRRIRP